MNNRVPGAVEEEVSQAAFAFYRARLKQRETKMALRIYREQHGACPLYDNGYHRDGRDGRPSCFQTSEPMSEWCEVCRGSQPLWEARRQAAKDAGVALKKPISSVCG